jgi:hypothetical protein
VSPIEIPQFFAQNSKHSPGSQFGALEFEFGPLLMGKSDLEGTVDHKERNSKTRSARKLNGAHHGVRALVEIQILHFLLVFFDIFSDSISIKEAHQFSGQFDKRCGL